MNRIFHVDPLICPCCHEQMSPVYYIIEGTKVIVPEDPTKEGCEFTGWNPEVPEKMPANDLVFEATWGEAAGDSDYNGAAEDVDVIPDTGSATAGIAAFAIISSAAAAAYVLTNRNVKLSYLLLCIMFIL